MPAANEGAPIDELVLWNAPAKGRSIVRAVRAPRRSKAHGAAPLRRRRATCIAASGYMLSAATASELAELRIDEVRGKACARARPRRMSVDAELVAALGAGGADVSSADGPG